MSDETSFRFVFIGLVLCLFLIRGYYSLRYRPRDQPLFSTRRETLAREGGPAFAFRVAIGTLFFLIVIMYSIDEGFLAFFSASFPPLIRWGGVVLAVPSFLLLAWAHKALGAYFSIDLRIAQRHALITLGPYRRIRHPMYTAAIMFMISIFLVSANWLVGLSLLVSIAFVLIRVKKEERMMLEQFGKQYEDYMGRSGRFLPR